MYVKEHKPLAMSVEHLFQVCTPEHTGAWAAPVRNAASHAAPGSICFHFRLPRSARFQQSLGVELLSK